MNIRLTSIYISSPYKFKKILVETICIKHLFTNKNTGRRIKKCWFCGTKLTEKS